jgi:hypothetical protein
VLIVVLRLITAPIRFLVTTVGFLLGALVFLATLAFIEIVGLYYYLRNVRPAALDRLLDGNSTVADLIEILLSVDVILVMLGLVVANIFFHYLAQTSDTRGMGGE